MKKSLLLIAVTLLTGTAIFAQNQAVRLTKFEGKTITGVTVSSGFEVEIIQGNNTKAVVEVNEELEKYLIYELSGGMLKIGINTKAFNKNNKALNDLLNRNRHRKATIIVNKLSDLKLSSSSRLIGTGSFEGDNLSIQVSSSSSMSGLTFRCSSAGITASSSAKITNCTFNSASDISVKASSSASLTNCSFHASQNVRMESSSSGRIRENNVTAQTITGLASSSGKIEIKGQGTKADFKASSSGSIDASTIRFQTGIATTNSSGSIQLGITQEADLKASSGGTITYSGNPPKVNNSTSGGGKIRSL